MSLVTQEAVEQYAYARKRGKKEVFFDRLNKEPAHIKVLDDIVNTYECSIEEVGQIEVPSFLIVGTKTSARSNSFSSGFMPLLRDSSEFAFKWCRVCEYHLSDTGISEPPEAYEYLGKFYITEGNKRVSVLKSYNAPFITCNVKRLVPAKSEDKEIKLYYEFLDFYKLSHLYSLQFKELGYYEKLQRLMGFEKDYVWDRRDRINLIGFYGRLENALKEKHLDVYHPDALIVMMENYGYDYLKEMSDSQLLKAIEEIKEKLLFDKPHYRILCVSDEEDKGLWNGYDKKSLENIDFIIACGDLKSEYLEYLVTISNKPLFYVHGNHDDQNKEEPGGCTCIDDKLVTYNGIRIVGFGGSYKYRDGKYMYTERQMNHRVNKLLLKILFNRGVDIVVTHAPIKGYGDLDDYAHQGFKCFWKLLEFRPKYFLYGHVHSRYAYNIKKEISYSDTQIINVSEKTIIIY